MDNLPIGSHLLSSRRFYIHHGIYLGNGDVAHYSGFSGSLKPGPIEVTDLEGFAHGKGIWVVEEQGGFSMDEIVVRARSRLGENRYGVLFNNCEHFCRWCIRGDSYDAPADASFFRSGVFSLAWALKA